MAPMLPSSSVRPLIDAEIAFAEPDAVTLEQPDKYHRNTQSDQGTPDGSPGKCSGHAEQDRAASGHQGAGRNGDPRPQGIGKHSGRNLHGGVDVEIHRRQRPERRARRIERFHQVGGNNRRRHAVKKHQHVDGDQNGKDRPAGQQESGAVIVVHAVAPTSSNCSSLIAISRILNFWILPEAVIG